MIFFFIVKSLLFLIFDFITLIKWKNFIKFRKKNKFLYIIPFILAIIMFFCMIYADFYNYYFFPTPYYLKYINILVTLWYYPKLIISLIILIISIIQLFTSFVKKIVTKDKKEYNKEKVLSSRRKFISHVTWGVAGIPFLAAFKGLTITIYDIKIYFEKLFFPKLEIEHKGLRIIHISDLHFSSYINQSYLLKLKLRIDTLKPDLIFITGDFVNFRYEELDFGRDFLNNLYAKYGVYACLGNHDHYMNESSHKKLIQSIKKTGVNLLINENITIDVNGKMINIVGVDNYGSRQTYGDFDKAFQDINFNNFTILMSHDPNTWEQFIVGKRNVELTLSGHTHGGQIALDFLGFNFSFAKIIYKYYKGLYSIRNQYLYVNRGIGVTGPPMRLGVNPEITFLTLNKLTNFA